MAVTDFEFYEGGLNNNGSLAFATSLADGRQLIVRADPDSQSVPEPSTILGVAIASVFGLFFKRHTNRN